MKARFFCLASGLAVALAFGLTGCGIVSFDMTESVPEQTIPGSPLAQVLPSPLAVPIPLNFDIKAETDKRSTGPATKVTLKSMSLSISAQSAGKNFDFLETIEIDVEAKDGSVTKAKVAELNPVPKGQTTIQLNVVPGVNLLPYLQAGAQLTAQGKATSPAQSTTFGGQIVVTITI